MRVVTRTGPGLVVALAVAGACSAGPGKARGPAPAAPAVAEPAPAPAEPAAPAPVDEDPWALFHCTSCRVVESAAHLPPGLRHAFGELEALPECGADDPDPYQILVGDITGDGADDLLVMAVAHWHAGGEGAGCADAFELRDGELHQILATQVGEYVAEREGGDGLTTNALRVVGPGRLAQEDGTTWTYDAGQHQFVSAGGQR